VRFLALLLAVGCAHALQKPPPIESVAKAPEADAGRLLAAADAAWARRPRDAGRAEELDLQAARAGSVQGFAGAIRAKAFLLGREKDPARRLQLAQSAVEVGQLCEERHPSAALCDYWLAVGLGLLARERHAAAKDALSHMVELLRRAARADERIDSGGPHRLLAIVLLRAPGWPVGPGDAEAALPEAKAAARIAPDYPPNQLALGEALRKNGQEAKDAYERALSLAQRSSDPDAPGWIDDARAALR
jgi:tetratricopeptide (TPR) repeat protein